MRDFHIPMAVLGVGLSIAILMLVRRDHLYIRQGLYWIVVALASLALGIWPGAIDWIGALVGVAYPPALLLLVAVIILMIRALLTDIALTRIRRDVRRLNQRIALLDADLAQPPPRPESADDRP